MNILKGILVELRERRLWPVAVTLVVGLIAVPVLLTKSAPNAAGVPSTGALPGTGAHGISVRLASNGPEPGLHGAARDPFTQQGGFPAAALAGSGAAFVGSAVTSGTQASGATLSVGGGAAAGASPGGQSSGGSSIGRSIGGGGSSAPSASGSSGTPAPAPSPSPAPRPSGKPGSRGLTPTQSYSVAIQVSNSSGGLNLIDPVERLSPIPNQSQPRLVELGVQQGGARVLFAVLPGTVVTGAGTCTPGPIDCEVLSLAPNQAEVVSTQSGTQVGEFAVTGISARQHPSVAAANQARNDANPAGSTLLAHAALPALSLFQYEPSVGAVVDLRNLTVGGN